MSSLIYYKLDGSLAARLVKALLENLPSSHSLIFAYTVTVEYHYYIYKITPSKNRTYMLQSPDLQEAPIERDWLYICNLLNEVRNIDYIAIDNNTPLHYVIYNERHLTLHEEFPIPHSENMLIIKASDTTLRRVPLNKEYKFDGVDENFFLIHNEKPLLLRYWIAGKEITLVEYKKELTKIVIRDITTLPSELNRLIIDYMV